MEKYSVITEFPEDMKCPICGSLLEKDSNVPKCPIHGTAPFEKEKNDEERRERK